MKLLASTSVMVLPMLFGAAIAKPDPIAPRALDIEGCYKSIGKSYDKGPGYDKFQSQGKCMEACKKLKKPLMALYGANECYCSDKWPSKDSKTSDSNCKEGCQGIDTESCGGKDAYGIYLTGEGAAPDDDDEEDSSATTTTTSSAPTSTKGVSVTTAKGGETVVVTASSSSETSDSEKDKGPNTAGIAAGVVVGVLALGAIIGGAFFFLKYRKRKHAAEQYQRHEDVSNFVAGGKSKGSSSMSDSRLDPTIMSQRRQSNGSIADDQDFSRRILQVTNPDGHGHY